MSDEPKTMYSVGAKGLDGELCIARTLDEVLDICDGDHTLAEYDVEMIQMSEDEYSELYEFEGF